MKSSSLVEISYSKATARKYRERISDQNPFQRDQSRIVYSIGFRILSGKTQVIPLSLCDNFQPRTRAQHSLEVVETSCRIARRLGLNVDAARVIAVGHDIGHIIGGHAGEEALNELIQSNGLDKYFSHDKQLLRVVTQLEQIKPKFKGLNLTKFVLQSFGARMLRANKKMEAIKTERIKLDFQLSHFADTLEGQLVEVIDKLVYLVHDIEDAIRIKALDFNMLRDFPYFADNRKCFEELIKQNSHDINLLLNRIKSQLYYYFLDSLHKQSSLITRLLNPNRFYLIQTQVIEFEPIVKKVFQSLKDAMYKNVYHGKPCENRDKLFKNKLIILFNSLMGDPQLLKTANNWNITWEENNPNYQRVIDVIWSMTEHMADSFIKQINPDFFKTS